MHFFTIVILSGSIKVSLYQRSEPFGNGSYKYFLYCIVLYCIVLYCIVGSAVSP